MSKRGIGDYGESFPRQVLPATGLVAPAGPANFPVSQDKSHWNEKQFLSEIARQITYQNLARAPILRSRDIDSNGDTLDWSQIGLMDKILIRNKGPNSVWIAFDISGPAVDAFTSDLSFELQAQESLSIPLCQFYKIGCKCQGGESGTVHAIAFQATAGDLGGSIS